MDWLVARFETVTWAPDDTGTGWISHQSYDAAAIHLGKRWARVEQEQTGKQQNYQGQPPAGAHRASRRYRTQAENYNGTVGTVTSPDPACQELPRS